MTLEEQIAWCNVLVRATSMSDKPFAEAILKSLRSLEAAERDAFDLRQATKLVILGQGLSQEDREACNAGSMAAIQLSKIQPSKLQSEGWVEVATILRRLGGQTT